jgi:hypothetical protein
MRFVWLCLCLLFPCLVWAQTGSITGKVQRMDTKVPLSKASVFLSNATYGTATNDDGTFTLTNIKPGQYELVVTMVGFEDFTQTVMVGKEPIKIFAELLPKVTELQTVTITSDVNWKANYQLFLKDFLGTSANAKKCKILNQHVIHFIHNKSKKLLQAYSDEFINVENRALGYNFKILLKSFKTDGINHLISWEGKVLFEEIKASDQQKEQWHERRRECYYGSSVHFFRSLLHNQLDQDGFVMMRLLRKPNLQRPPEELIQKKLDKFNQPFLTVATRDSLIYWRNEANLPKYNEDLIRTPIPPSAILRNTDQPNIYAITFPDYLYVIYTKRKETEDFRDVYRPLDMENYETSVVTLYKHYTMFDPNGVVVLPQTTLFEGAWSKAKIAELLPLDYSPDER